MATTKIEKLKISSDVIETIFYIIDNYNLTKFDEIKTYIKSFPQWFDTSWYPPPAGLLRGNISPPLPLYYPVPPPPLYILRVEETDQMILDLIEYFEVNNLDRIPPALIKMALTNKPEWLRGKDSIEKLPRYNSNLSNSESKKFLILGFDMKETIELVCMIVENFSGGWQIDNMYLYLENQEDIMYYSLLTMQKPK